MVRCEPDALSSSALTRNPTLLRRKPSCNSLSWEVPRWPELLISASSSSSDFFALSSTITAGRNDPTSFTLADVVALERTVELISEGFFDGHNVLFADTQKQLTSSHETSRLLVVGYMDNFLNEWVMLSRGKVLVASGEIFGARDEVSALLKTDDLGTNP